MNSKYLESYDGLLSKYHPVYKNNDIGSARCRLNIELFRLYNINIGNIIEFLLDVIENDIIIDSTVLICTAFPHTHYIPNSTICFDDTVIHPKSEDFLYNSYSYNSYNSINSYTYKLSIKHIYQPTCNISSIKCSYWDKCRVKVGNNKEIEPSTDAGGGAGAGGAVDTELELELGIARQSRQSSSSNLDVVHWIDLESLTESHTTATNTNSANNITNNTTITNNTNTTTNPNPNINACHVVGLPLKVGVYVKYYCYKARKSSIGSDSGGMSGMSGYLTRNPNPSTADADADSYYIKIE